MFETSPRILRRTIVQNVPLDLVFKRRRASMSVSLIDQCWRGHLSRLAQTTLFTVRFLVERGREGLNSTVPLGSALLSQLMTLTYGDALQPVLLGQLNDKRCCLSANICFPLAAWPGTADPAPPARHRRPGRTPADSPVWQPPLTATVPPLGHASAEENKTEDDSEGAEKNHSTRLSSSQACVECNYSI